MESSERLQPVRDATDSPVLRAVIKSPGVFANGTLGAKQIAVNEYITGFGVTRNNWSVECINLSAVEFYDERGLLIEPDKVVSHVEFSGYQFSRDSPDQVKQRLFDRTLLHTSNSVHPWMRIDFVEPTFVSSVLVHNRSDRNASRAQGLRFEIFSAVGPVAVGGSPSRHEALRGVLDVLGLRNLDCLGADHPAAASILRKEISKRLLASPADPTVPNLLSLLPIYDNTEQSDHEFDLIVLARYVNILLDLDDFVPTTRLRFAEKVLRRKSDIAALFDFSNQISEVRGLAPNIVGSNHTINRSKLLSKRADILREYSALESILSNNRIFLQVAYGTLLGFIREGDLLSHDDDFDVIYDSGASSEEEAMAHREELKRILNSTGYSVWDAGRYNLHVKRNGVTLDLFPMWVSGTEAYIMRKYGHYEPLSARNLFPSGRLRVDDFEINVPARAEDVLAWRYGQSWLTPDPTFGWPWELADQ